MSVEIINTRDSFETWRVKINRALTSVQSSSLGGGGTNISQVAGVDITGVNDSTGPVLTTLQTTGHVYIPQGVKILVDKLTMPPGTRISGPGKIVYIFTNQTDDATIYMQTDCVVEGVTFVPYDPISIARTIIYSANSENIRILNNNFEGTLSSSQFYFGYETYILLDQRTVGAKVIGNTMYYGKYGIFNTDVSKCIFAENWIEEPTVNGMTFYGGKYNTVQANHIIGRNHQYSIDGGAVGDSAQGTVTGISFLTRGFLGSRRGIIGNRVIGNYVYGITEEAISFDTSANSTFNAPENYVLAIGTVQSVAASGVGNVVITLQEPTTQGGIAAPSDWAIGYFAIGLTGAGTGYAAKVISCTSSSGANSSTLTINQSAGIPPFATGDKILITCGVMFNEIIGNTVDQVTSGLILYGSSWFNRVEGNNVRAISTGIEIASIVAGLVIGSKVDGTPADGSGVQSYSGCCTVTNNTVVLDYEGQPSNYDRGSSNSAGPIAAGTWAYGTPVISAQNPGMTIANNRFFGNRTSKIGGSFATQDAGNSSMTYPIVTGNTSMGGTSIVLNKTSGAFVGPNWKTGVREDYQTSGSANNTGITNAA